jgi:hypothetical protein
MEALPMEFRFEPQPKVAEWLTQHLRATIEASAWLSAFERRLARETSTRLTDFVDRMALAVDASELSGLGFWEQQPRLWVHTAGLFPVVAQRDGVTQLLLRVDDVVAFAQRHGCDQRIEGAPWAPLRRLLVSREKSVETFVVERHGGRLNDDEVQSEPRRVLFHRDAMRTRQRSFGQEAEAFEHAFELARAATGDLGPAFASDLFFAAEREYWQARNEAGALQKVRQDALGLGWGNHDHHTYRSSREHFRGLMRVLEALGMSCRERFYAGAEAGWGAQVLEHVDTGAMVFADVDMSPDEVMLDFAHEGLAPRPSLGTVGLWCKLHGEALLEAGMHHLEGQFDFAAATRWFEDRGGTMPPFTNFSYLKIELLRPDTPPADDPGFVPYVLEDEVTYDDVAPWPTQADGSGASLTRIAADAWGNAPTSWTAASPSLGTTDFSTRLPGDTNEDGLFNQDDLNSVLQSGKYMTGQPASFEEGDWNGDGVFDQKDVVVALQSGNYEANAAAALRSHPSRRAATESAERFASTPSESPRELLQPSRIATSQQATDMLFAKLGR